MQDFGRKLKLQNYFSHRPNSFTNRSKFTPKSTWTPPSSMIDKPVLDCISAISKEIENLKIQPETKNLTKMEYKTIKNLQNNVDLVIKKADKGSAVVIMDRQNYINEGFRQLYNPAHYREIDTPLYLENSEKITKILKGLRNSGCLSEKVFQFLLPPERPRQRRFYMLPKIHKPKDSWPIPNVMPPGRPIVSDCSSESEKVAMYIDSYIKDQANKHPSYIKNTYDFLDKVRGLELDPNSLLITLDVESMYTNINHEEGIQAIKNAFPTLKNNELFKGIIELLEISLKCNDFEFDGKTFLQVSGTAMGQKYAPHYADIYMAEFEKQALQKCPFKPDCYYRYLDDIFLIWPHGISKFNQFLEIFNSHRASIKFKAEISTDSVNFLDTTLFRSKENTLEAKVFFKPTDTHQLLHKLSFHPKHTYKGLIKSQVFRFFQICSYPDDVESACQILFKALSKRNYSKRWLRKIKNETLRILNSEERLGADFQLPTSSSSGSKPCNSRQCQTCHLVPNCQNFSGSVFEQTYSINSALDCNSENIIYLYTCKLCEKQYVGETGKSLKFRNNRHRAAITSCNEENALYSHLSKFHSKTEFSIECFSLLPIEQVSDLGDELLNKQWRLEREYCWIDTLGTFEPHGLNVQKFTKYDPLNKSKNKFDLVYIVPFSKTGALSAQIVKKHMKQLNKNTDGDIKIATAYKKHQNLKELLVRSKLK